MELQVFLGGLLAYCFVLAQDRFVSLVLLHQVLIKAHDVLLNRVDLPPVLVHLLEYEIVLVLHVVNLFLQMLDPLDGLIRLCPYFLRIVQIDYPLFFGLFLSLLLVGSINHRCILVFYNKRIPAFPLVRHLVPSFLQLLLDDFDLCLNVFLR